MHQLVEEFLVGRFEELEANGFEPIVRSPCMMLQGTLRAYKSLGAEGRGRYRRIIAQTRAAFWLPNATPLSSADSLWFSRFSQSSFPPQYPSLNRTLARAADLRKVAKPCFEHFLGCAPERSEGNPGDWLVDGVIQGIGVSVELRYACRGTQLQYGVHADGMQPFVRVSAEMLYGLGLGSWNQVYLSEAEQLFALLRDFISMVIHDHSTIIKIIRGNA